MPGVTEQEIAQAKQMNLYQYMQLCEPDNFRPEGPGQFRHKGHSSLTFAEDGSWTYFKTKATGRTALNYLIAVEGVSFVEAVREINRIQGGISPSFQPVKASPPAERKPTKKFSLPRPDKNNYAAIAYLRKRCIHPNVLMVCKQKKILYQTSFKDHPNCVFVGRDGNGEAKGGSLRGCSKIQFRRDIPGSKKIYPFYIEAAADADTVEVYEAPIDAMSVASLKIMSASKMFLDLFVVHFKKAQQPLLFHRRKALYFLSQCQFYINISEHSLRFLVVQMLRSLI